MKHLILAAAVAFAPGMALAADPLLGTWATIADDNGNSGHITISECGAKLCGVLSKSFDKSGKLFVSANQGKKLLWDMEAKGGGSYSGGKVWSPDRDKTYNGRLELAGNKLTVKGCVLGICREGGVWSRVN